MADTREMDVECPGCGHYVTIKWDGMDHNTIYVCPRLSCNAKFTVERVEYLVATEHRPRRLRRIPIPRK